MILELLELLGPWPSGPPGDAIPPSSARVGQPSSAQPSSQAKPRLAQPSRKAQPRAIWHILALRNISLYTVTALFSEMLCCRQHKVKRQVPQLRS